MKTENQNDIEKYFSKILRNITIIFYVVCGMGFLILSEITGDIVYSVLFILGAVMALGYMVIDIVKDLNE